MFGNRRRAATPPAAVAPDDPTVPVGWTPGPLPDATATAVLGGVSTHRPSADTRRDLPPAHHTATLEPMLAGAFADPGAHTEVLARPAPSTPQEPGPPPPPPPLLSRRAAAELGVYLGALLAVLAVAGVALRGWSDWSTATRAVAVGLTSVALLATGLFVRLPWGRRPGPERRRAVSAMLTAGTGLVLTASALALDVRQGAPTATAIGHSIAAVLVMLLVAAVARTPLAESGVLAAAAWAVWLLVPTGPWMWGSLVLLGLTWAALGWRLARGRRTAALVGTGLALGASVGLAHGPLMWPVRAALAVVTVLGLVGFLRGGPNPRLALGAGAAMALAAAVAGGSLGPAPALLVGGLATMAVSAIALRGARRVR